MMAAIEPGKICNTAGLCVCCAILCQNQLPNMVKKMLTFLILEAFNGAISVS